MRFKIFPLLIFLIFAVFRVFGESLGSAKKLDGNIVVISIFADDLYSSWGENRVNKYAEDTMNYMKIATEWICQNAKRYGADPNFVYNFFEGGGLYYRVKFALDMTDWRLRDSPVWKYIRTRIDLKWVMEEYGAESVLFMVYLNTPRSNQVKSAARSFVGGMGEQYEIVYINRYHEKKECSPAIYAHEILHTFGARDLYYADERNGFSAEFLDFCKKAHANDIMFTISDSERGGVYFHKITNELSDLDAYYLGLCPDCPERRKFSIPKSEHFDE